MGTPIMICPLPMHSSLFPTRGERLKKNTTSGRFEVRQTLQASEVLNSAHRHAITHHSTRQAPTLGLSFSANQSQRGEQARTCQLRLHVVFQGHRWQKSFGFNSG